MDIKQDPFEEREKEKYPNPIQSREFISAHLVERGAAATMQQLQEELGITDPDQEEALRRRLIAMVRDGQLLRNRRGAYGPVKSMALITGAVIGHKDGFGFVTPDEGGDDLFLTPYQMRLVFPGDRVLVRAVKGEHGNRREATIVEVLEHQTKQLVGRLCIESGVSYVEPSHTRITQAILIPPDATHEAKDGDMVVVAITTQPTRRTRPLGEVIEVLGDHMAPGMEIDVAIRSYDLPYRWSDAVIAEADAFPPTVQEAEIVGRADFRQLPFVTIDGDDAKDFDDAVYCEPQKKGGFTLYVAIADVSHYVKPGMALDKEAYVRGNSVYFPGRVVPMLPETLSNNLCSLKPDVDRLVLVCEMAIKANGDISSYQFHEGVIHSHARLTYDNVHAMIEENSKPQRKQFAAVVPHLENLYALFHILHEARKQRGAIDFDLPETKIIFGKNRKIEKIVPYERFNSHRVIEECMLSANICAAKFLEKHKQAALYRVHEGPTEDKLNDLKRFISEMGLKMPLHEGPVPSDYAAVLRETADRPDARLIQTVLLRSMSQAIYTPHNKGHFGLAYEAYTHYTSPIRRYPDLLTHRGIRHLLQQKTADQDVERFVLLGEHCSMTERRADDATNDAKDWLRCEFMLDKVGQEFAGTISGVTGFGLFVELNAVYVEGLVHISALPDDYYRFESVRHMLVGEHSGRQFRLGDTITIRVARVDLDQRKIDFVLAEGVKGELSRKGQKKPAQKKQGAKKKHAK